jgi:MFS family permease
MAYFRFFLSHPRVLSFGVLLTLFSSFGQTFLISIFVPRLLESFELNTAQFGALYAAATLLSATSLPFFGQLIDRVTLRSFSLAVGLGLVLSCFALALAPHVVVLFLAILGLRLTGQGLLSLTASTTMARVFVEGRGKALSVSGLGYPLGEGLLPMAIVLLIHAAGWRLSWGILGTVIAVLLLPAMISLLREVEPLHQREVVEHQRHPQHVQLLRDGRFYLLLPGTLFLPCVLTGLFLYQVPLAEDRGWSVETMATAFVGFAVARMVSSLMVGPLIDRCGAVRLFPVILVPACAGLVLLSLGSSLWIVFAYLALVGVSQGIASPMMTALWAEVYGVESLGATKSKVSMLGIFATALGPLLLGTVLKAGVTFAVVIPACAILGVLASGVSVLARALLVKQRLGARAGDVDRHSSTSSWRA